LAPLHPADLRWQASKACDRPLRRSGRRSPRDWVSTDHRSTQAQALWEDVCAMGSTFDAIQIWQSCRDHSVSLEKSPRTLIGNSPVALEFDDGDTTKRAKLAIRTRSRIPSSVPQYLRADPNAFALIWWGLRVRPDKGLVERAKSSRPERQNVVPLISRKAGTGSWT
jgi:hypothetical protein